MRPVSARAFVLVSAFVFVFGFVFGFVFELAGGAGQASASPATPRGWAAADPAAFCEQAISRAARRHGTPERLLRALAKVESGRNARPWPWTVNAGGEGRWFDSKTEALAFAERKLAAGVRSIDFGCLQINRIWHGDAFADHAAMLDPDQNADYAARFLARLKAETGDWMRAAGYYHSRTQKHFERYSALVAAAFADLTPQPAPPRPVTAAPPRLPDPAAPAATRRQESEVWSGLLRKPRAGLFAQRRAIAADARPEMRESVVAQPALRGGVALSFDRAPRALPSRPARQIIARRRAPLDLEARPGFLTRR